MNRRIVAPWKLVAVAFGAPVVIAAAAMLAIAVLTAPSQTFPSESDPRAGVLPVTEKPTTSLDPSQRVINPQVTAETINGDERVAASQPEPTAAATPVSALATEPPAIVRQPVAVDAPPPPPAPVPTPLPTPTPVPGEYRLDITEQLYTMLNNERTSRGLNAVVRNQSLIGAAEHYSRLVFLRDPYDLNHWLDGGPGDRAWSRGYCCGVGEILVESEGSAQGMVDLWMSSPPHSGVILNPQYVSFGIACYGGAAIGDDGNLHHPIVCVGDFGSG